MGVLVEFVTLLLVASGYRQVHSLVSEYVPHTDVNYVAKARIDNARGAPPQQVYDADVHKCRCGGNEAWDGKDCLGTQTYVAVTNPNTHQSTAAPTSTFRVTVGEVRCSQDQDVKVTLIPNKDSSNQFSLLPNGSLYWQGHPYENYCFDHTLDEEGKPTSWEAKVCLPPPVVPRCCHGASLASDGSCNTGSAHRSSPPIMVNELLMKWPGEVPEKRVNVKCKENENLLTLPLNTGETSLVYESGGVSLVWSSANMRQNIQKEDYCVEPEMEEENYVAYVCYADQIAIHQRLCGNATCVRKCCPEGEIMHGTDCLPGNYSEFLWVPTFTDANDFESSVGPPEDLTLIYGLPDCEKYVLDPYARKEDKFLLLNNGELFHPSAQDTFPSTHYCIDNFVSREEKPQSKTLALVCFTEVDIVCNTVKNTVYPALLLVSSVFLGVTLVVYISVPDIRDKLHRRCLISLVAALFVAYTLLATTKLRQGNTSELACSILASVTHVSMLAAFFWLNVMCFDIWRTLRKTRTVVDGGRFGRRRFLLYSLYAWGCPLLITVTAVTMEHLPPSHDVIRPNFRGYCWFQGQASHWLYLYGWVLVLVVSNIILFSLVASILCKAQNDPLLRRSRDYNRERMWLYVKLFLVMGVTWLAEVVSWHTGACRALIATNVLNALQGFTLFLVFVCKKTTLKKIKRRFGSAWMMVSRTTTMSSSLSSTVSRTGDNNLSVFPVKRSEPPNTKVRSSPSAATLHTQQKAPDEPSELPRGGLQETTTMIPKRDRDEDTEVGTAEEATPSKTTIDFTLPSRSLETHFDG